MTRLEIAARIAAGLAAHPEISSSLIPEQSLSIADELIKLEAETRPKPEFEQELPFEMVVGGVYLNREGREEEIVGKNSHSHNAFFPFVGKSGQSYTGKGTILILEESPYDLIKRIR